MPLSSKRYKVADMMAAQEFFHSRKWTDGLPVVPPTAGAVEECLEWVMMPPEHLIGIEPVRERAITAENCGKCCYGRVLTNTFPCFGGGFYSDVTRAFFAPWCNC